MAFTASACTPEHHPSPTDLPPGEYKSVNKTTDSSGTITTTRDTTNVGVDAYGNKRAVVQKKKTTDPRGLFNKNTSESTTVVEEK
ncbi:MAG: hypothetical protein K2Q01_03730 [Rickettsiales bacterium]|nr:hypothetical protein [Rickettsiales bacterium]